MSEAETIVSRSKRHEFDNKLHACCHIKNPLLLKTERNGLCLPDVHVLYKKNKVFNNNYISPI